MAGFKIKGLDNLQKQFEKMEREAEKLEKGIPLFDLFPSSFMKKYTSFFSFEELLKAGGFHAETNEEFEAIPDREFDAHIVATTKFSSWKEMLNEATEQHVKKKLGF